MQDEPNADIGQQEAEDRQKQQEDRVVAAALVTEHRPAEPVDRILPQRRTVATEHRTGRLLEGEERTQRHRDQMH